MPTLASISDHTTVSPSTPNDEQDVPSEADLTDSLVEVMVSADKLWLGEDSSFKKGQDLGKHFNDIRGISDRLKDRFLQQEWETGFAHYFGFVIEREPETLAGFVSAVDLASMHSFGHGDMPAGTWDRLTSRWFQALKSLDLQHPIEPPNALGTPAEDDALSYHAEVLRRLTERFPEQPSLGASSDGKCLDDFM